MFFNKKLHAQIRNLQSDKESLETQLKWLKDKKERLEEKLIRSDRQESATYRAKRMTGIKFKALFDGRYQEAHFTIGLGQCGKTVKYFTIKIAEGLLWIYQWHTDGTHKEFTYRLSDVDGRIQYDYEMVILEGREAMQARRLNFDIKLSL